MEIRKFLNFQGEKMVDAEKHKKDVSNLYDDMLVAQEAYKEAFIKLNNTIELFFGTYYKEDQIRVRVDEFNFTVVRCSEEISKDVLDRFQEKFNVNLMWIKNEVIEDFRNLTEVDAVVFEYGFYPPIADEEGEEDDRDISDK